MIIIQVSGNTLVQSLNDSWKNFLDKLPGILLAIVVIALGILLAKKASQIFRNTISKRSDDPLMTNFLAKSFKLVLIIVSIMFALRIAGLDGIAATLLTAAGASAVILGFAFRDIGENFISGIILSFQRPFQINDTIQVGDIFGKVKALEFRYTKVKTFDGKDVYIPNSDVIKKPLINYTEDGLIRWDFTVGIAYEDDASSAQNLIEAVVNETEGVVNSDTYETYSVVEELSVSTVNIKVFFWVSSLDFRKAAFQTRGVVIDRVKKALEKNGFSMPADIQEIKIYGSQQSIPISIRSDSEPKKTAKE